MSKDGQDEQVSQTPVEPLGLLWRGIAMGAADVVPGVSGGTIAFITGIYEQFINALKSLSAAPLIQLGRGDFRSAWSRLLEFHWRTLLPLGVGVAISVVALSKVVTSGMDSHPAETYSLFFGLILSSTYAPYVAIKNKNFLAIGVFLVAAALAFGFVGLHPATPEKAVSSKDSTTTLVYTNKVRSEHDLKVLEALRDTHNSTAQLVVYDPKNKLAEATLSPTTKRLKTKQDLKEWYETKALDAPSKLGIITDRSPNLLWIFCSGIIAISAMVLPGLSGSFLLLFLGLYHVVFGALHGFIGAVLAKVGRVDVMVSLAGEQLGHNLAIVVVFGVGILLGLALFSRIVSWLFTRAPDITLAALTGLMIGALRLPAQRVYDATEQLQSGVIPSALSAVLGIGLVIALTLIDRRNQSS